MGWTAGNIEGVCTARDAIVLALGREFAPRVIDTAHCRGIIYAAILSSDGYGVSGLVLLTERRDGRLFTKPIPEDMGPVEDGCPARILRLLTPTSNENARGWRDRCRKQLAAQQERGAAASGRNIRL